MQEDVRPKTPSEADFSYAILARSRLFVGSRSVSQVISKHRHSLTALLSSIQETKSVSHHFILLEEGGLSNNL